MISFRLTQDEYEKFRQVCFTHGIKSVSEIARAAINLLLQEPIPAPNKPIESRGAERVARVDLLVLDKNRLHPSSIPLSVDFSSTLSKLDTAQQHK